MRLALLSDIHANLLGMQACIAHAQEQGADQFALLGDFVGYGPEPAEVLDLARDMAEAGAWLIKGNHDDMALNPPTLAKTLGEVTALWTHQQLGSDHLAFLRELPMLQQHGRVLLVHASANEPAAWHYVYDQARARDGLDALATRYGQDLRFSFVGHVHAQTLYSRDGQGAVTQVECSEGVAMPLDRQWHWLATVGSAGQPRDGDPRAMYSLFDTTTESLYFHRVAYDHFAAAHRVRGAGLPEWLAQRLEQGR